MACVSLLLSSRTTSTWFCSESIFPQNKFRSRSLIFCRAQDGDKKSNGEEPPESLFMKELKKRGMTSSSSSLIEEKNTSVYESGQELKVNEDERIMSKRNLVSTEIEKGLSNQRERSMELNSEGLEGLLPRAKVLLTLGGTFFLGFWPLILITIAFFSALYFYLGPSFVHDGSRMSVAPPPYIDPYTLLEEERMSQTAPLVK